MKKFLAAVGTAAVILTGATACGSNAGYTDNGYEQVWDHGHSVYVPYSYYQSHRNYYDHTGHAVTRRSSSYVTKHHVTVSHKTTTTVHSNGKRVTKHTTTTHKHTTTRRSTRRR